MKKRRNLPSLGSLAAFEAAAKHLSFTKAAGELNVTQAAVSQQVRILEDYLECKLFLRQANGLELTWEGDYFLQSVTQGLDILSGSVNALIDEEEHPTMTISSTTGVAQLFLFPIIDRFRGLKPDVEVTILASDEDDSLRNYKNMDFAFVCGNERSEVGSKIYYLFSEIVQPVCSPGYYEKHGPFPTAESLNKACLLHLHEKHWSSKAIDWQPLSWNDWFEANNATLERQTNGLLSNSYPLLVEAAIAGQGIILGWKHLVTKDVEEGRLVYANPLEFRVDRLNYVKLGSRGTARPWLQLFLDLVLEEAERINQSVSGSLAVGRS